MITPLSVFFVCSIDDEREKPVIPRGKQILERGTVIIILFAPKLKVLKNLNIPYLEYQKLQ